MKSKTTALDHKKVLKSKVSNTCEGENETAEEKSDVSGSQKNIASAENTDLSNNFFALNESLIFGDVPENTNTLKTLLSDVTSKEIHDIQKNSDEAKSVPKVRSIVSHRIYSSFKKYSVREVSNPIKAIHTDFKSNSPRNYLRNKNIYKPTNGFSHSINNNLSPSYACNSNDEMKDNNLPDVPNHDEASYENGSNSVKNRVFLVRFPVNLNKSPQSLEKDKELVESELTQVVENIAKSGIPLLAENTLSNSTELEPVSEETPIAFLAQNSQDKIKKCPKAKAIKQHIQNEKMEKVKCLPVKKKLPISNEETIKDINSTSSEKNAKIQNFDMSANSPRKNTASCSKSALNKSLAYKDSVSSSVLEDLEDAIGQKPENKFKPNLRNSVRSKSKKKIMDSETSACDEIKNSGTQRKDIRKNLSVLDMLKLYSEKKNLLSVANIPPIQKNCSSDLLADSKKNGIKTSLVSKKRNKSALPNYEKVINKSEDSEQIISNGSEVFDDIDSTPVIKSKKRGRRPLHKTIAKSRSSLRNRRLENPALSLSPGNSDNDISIKKDNEETLSIKSPTSRRGKRKKSSPVASLDSSDKAVDNITSTPDRKQRFSPRTVHNILSSLKKSNTDILNSANSNVSFLNKSKVSKKELCSPEKGNKISVQKQRKKPCSSETDKKACKLETKINKKNSTPNSADKLPLPRKKRKYSVEPKCNLLYSEQSNTNELSESEKSNSAESDLQMKGSSQNLIYENSIPSTQNSYMSFPLMPPNYQTYFNPANNSLILGSPIVQYPQVMNQRMLPNLNQFIVQPQSAYPMQSMFGNFAVSPYNSFAMPQSLVTYPIYQTRPFLHPSNIQCSNTLNTNFKFDSGTLGLNSPNTTISTNHNNVGMGFNFPNVMNSNNTASGPVIKKVKKFRIVSQANLTTRQNFKESLKIPIKKEKFDKICNEIEGNVKKRSIMNVLSDAENWFYPQPSFSNITVKQLFSRPTFLKILDERICETIPEFEIPPKVEYVFPDSFFESSVREVIKDYAEFHVQNIYKGPACKEYFVKCAYKKFPFRDCTYLCEAFPKENETFGLKDLVSYLSFAALLAILDECKKRKLL